MQEETKIGEYVEVNTVYRKELEIEIGECVEVNIVYRKELEIEKSWFGSTVGGRMEGSKEGKKDRGKA